MAQDPADSLIYVAGAHQAEYQTWLSVPGKSNDFIRTALEVLSRRFPGQLVRFLYLPSSERLEDLIDSGSDIGKHVFVRSHARPFLSIGDGTKIIASLKKKGNRSKLNRLKRRGELSL